MTSARAVLSLLLYGLLLPLGSQEQVTAITDVKVVDGTGAPAYQGTVLIRGERITAAGPQVAVPAGATVIRAGQKTLLPGLFDVHTHLPYATATGVEGDWPKQLAAYLHSGVTSVVDFGTYPETFAAMRELVRSGAVAGPRLLLAARFTTPGGHGAEGGRGDFFTQEVNGPREARAAVRRILPYRPDVIKVFTDGWRYGTAPDMTFMREDTLTALVDEAHKSSLPVLTHTVTLDKAKIAARSNVDVLAHGIGDVPADAELIAILKEHHTAYAPTMAVYEPRLRTAVTPALRPLLEPVVFDAIPNRTEVPMLPMTPGSRTVRWGTLLGNTGALHRAGILVATGTDAGIVGTHHGWATLREIQLMVAAGLTPLEAITAATGNAARALRLDKERGTIAPGKLADLVLVDGMPHEDIVQIERISRVWLGGREIDRPALARLIASADPAPMPALPATAKIAGFERADGRTDVNTRVVSRTDPDHDHSHSLFGRTLRRPGNYALTTMSEMSSAERPYVQIQIPLTPGAVQAVDASRFHGVQFDTRGEGEYRLRVACRAVRDFAHFQAQFSAGGKWQSVKIPFASLQQEKPKRPVAWTGHDVTLLSFEMTRPAGAKAWLELDNLRFY